MWKIILYTLYCKHKNKFILFIINLFIYLLFYRYRLQIKWDHKIEN
jgi:hypothetical protein